MSWQSAVAPPAQIRGEKCGIYFHSMKRALLCCVVVLLIACAGPAPEVDPDYNAEIESWRASRLDRLTSDTGWLTVVGLYWLEPGIHRFGADPDNEIPLAVPDIPAFAGTIEVGADGSVVARAVNGCDLRVNSEPVVESSLKTDVPGPPDVVEIGRANFYIIERGGKLAARVKDPQAPTRATFVGIDHFPLDPQFRLVATLEPYDFPREVKIPTVVGTPATMLAPGLLRFSLDGEELRLEPYISSPEDASYFLIFRDLTSGHTTYGAGRFLSADTVGPDGTTVLDFNLAYNPPCAFTPYATCPLPTPQNSLSVAVEAGERYDGEKH